MPKRISTRAGMASSVLAAISSALLPGVCEAASAAAASDEQPTRSEEAQAVQAAGSTSRNVIESLKSRLPPGSQGLADEALQVINELIKSTRADQGSMYLFVRTVNRNMDVLAATCEECDEYVKSIRATNRKLMRSSYTDGLFQNGNLSNQVQTRLPLLLADSLKLHVPDSEFRRDDFRRDDFREELELLSDRFLGSKRFRAGLGLAYSYLPRFTYTATPRVDFSPFQTESAGGSDRVIFNADFSNRTVPALTLSAKVPLMQIDVAIPDIEHKETITTPVEQRRGDGDNDLLSRTTIASKLRIDYDVALKVSVIDAYNWWRENRQKRTRGNFQFDFGFGLGMTGFQIKDDVTTDLRLRADASATFNELAPGPTIESTHTNSFNTPFISLHYTFKVSDEFQLGLESRYYQKDRKTNSQVDIGGAPISLSAIWYPTFNW